MGKGGGWMDRVEGGEDETASVRRPHFWGAASALARPRRARMRRVLVGLLFWVFFGVFSFFFLQAQPSERSGPRPLHPSFSLLHKNISDVGEVHRPRVRRRRAGREKRNKHTSTKGL